MSSQASAKQKNTILMVALVATLALTAWTAFNADTHDDAVELVEATHSSTPLTKKFKDENIEMQQDSKSQDNDVLFLAKRETPKESTIDLFKVHSWVVVPPVKKMARVAPPPPPPPEAPQVPFTYVGKMDGTPNGNLIFLMFNNQLLSVAQGKNVTPDWRVDSENANMVKFTYLPLNLPKVLVKGAQVNPSPLNTAQGNVPQ